MKDKTLRSYLIWAFALAWPLQALGSWFMRSESMEPLTRQTAFTIILAVSMCAPFAAVLLARAPLRSIGWRPKLKGNLRWYLAAWLLPSVLCTLGAALYFLLFPSRFDASLSSYFATLPPEALEQFEAQGLSSGAMAAISIVSSVSYAPFINIIFALGEEIGWRGFLTPRLTERLGRRKGLLLSGVIWGVWHWPVIVLAGYEYGLEYWGAPVLGPLLFCVFTTALGILFSLLYDKTGSIWICALAHAAINAFANVPSMFLNADSGYQQTLGPYANGVIGGLPLLLLAAAVLLKDPPEPREMTE